MGLTNLDIYNRYSVREFTRKIEIKRRNTDGVTYEADWQDVEDLSGLRLLDKAVSTISYNVANNNYNFGIATTGNVTIKLNSKNGQFDDDSNSGSVFKGFLRHKSLIRVTDGFVDNYTDPDNPVDVYNTVFEGFIDITATGTKVDDENLIQDFQCIDLLSFLLKEYTVSDMGSLTSTTLSDLIYEILNRSEFTEFFSVKTANITPGYDITSFDISQYEAQTQLFTLFENFSIGHSFFYVRDEVFYYTSSITPNTTKKYPFEFTGMKIRPDNYASLRYWNDLMDEASVIRNDSDEIERLIDKSGNSEGAKQYNSIKKPLYNQSHSLNNLPSMDFDGVDDTLKLPDSLHDITNADNTIFVVSRSTQDLQTDNIINFSVSGATRGGIRYQSSSGEVIYLNATAFTPVTATGVVKSNFNILQGGKEGTEQAISVNGSAAITNSNGSNQPSTNAAYIGSLSGSSDFLNGSILEILIFDEALSSSEKNEILYYLSQKWKIEANIDYDLLQTSFDNLFKFQGMGIQPDNISELRYWNDLMDEASIIKNDSDEIERLIDKSGDISGGDQYDPARKPSYNSTSFGGEPCSVFNGTSDYIKAVTNGIMNGEDAVSSVFCVFKKTTGGSGDQFIWGFSEGGGSLFSLYVQNATNKLVVIRRDAAFTSVSKTSVSAITEGQEYIVSCIINTLGTSIDVYIDGVKENNLSGSYNVGDCGTLQTLYLGSRGAGNFFTGELAEISIHGKTLNSTEINELTAYFSNKWGISATYDSGSLQTEFDTQYDFNLVLPISVDQAKLIRFSSYNNGISNIFERFFWEEQPTITYTAPVNKYNRSKTINIDGCTDNTQRQNVLNTIGAIAKEERREFKITIPYFMEIFVMDTIIVSSPTIIPDDAFIWGVSKWGDGSKWRKSLQADNIPNNVAWLVRAVRHSNFKTELTLQEII